MDKIRKASLHRALGIFLTTVREKKGLSQEALATQLGKNQSDIAKMESGQTKTTVIDLLKFAKALGLSIEDLAKGLAPILKDLEGPKSLWNK